MKRIVVRHTLATIASFIAVTLTAIAHAQPATADAVRQELATTDQVIWQGQHLRAGLENLTHSWGIPIFLDRRVDPNQLIDFEDSNKTRDELLRGLAAQLQLKVCVVDTVVYLGPAETANVLASIAETRFDEAQKWTGGTGSLLRKRSNLQWEQAAEPAAVLQQLASKLRVDILDADKIPHDLWPAAQWKSLPSTHQLALMLAGFGLTYELVKDQSAIRLIPMPSEFALVRKYPMTGNAAQRVTQLQQNFPDSTFTLNGRSLTVSGPAEDHFWVRRRLAGLGDYKQREVAADRLRYTLNIEQQPFGAVAQTVAKALKLELRYDDQITDIKNQRIDMTTRDATREELLETLVKSVDLRYTIKDETLLIHP